MFPSVRRPENVPSARFFYFDFFKTNRSLKSITQLVVFETFRLDDFVFDGRPSRAIFLFDRRPSGANFFVDAGPSGANFLVDGAVQR